MHNLIAAIALMLLISSSINAKNTNYKGSLYKNLTFHGSHLTFNGQTIQLGPQAFFIDGELSDAEVAKHKYVFNSLQNAVKQLKNGTEATPMTLYFAPWVYWVDDPDDPNVRVPKQGTNTPFGMEINCEWLRFYGLTDDPTQVILATNRGQTMGAKGNFTMFNIKGDGLSSENITFGNYCNIDLEYPAKPALGRKKRGDAIVQAQLIFANGDKVVARNTHFISRLNTGPFWGSKRTLFDHCHFESTDDALNGSGVYLNCTLDFYSSKPFGHTVGTGATFLNCDFRVFTRGSQYLVKGSGPVTLVDCRFSGDEVKYLGWRDHPATEARYYASNVSLNGQAIFMDPEHSYATIEMQDKQVLNAYRFSYGGNTIYNTYNLLKGNDEWDPMGIKPIVEKAEKKSNEKLSNIPTLLKIEPPRKKLETGKDTLTLTAHVFRFGNFEINNYLVSWSIAPEYGHLAKINTLTDGTCRVIPHSNQNETQDIIIKAKTTSGLESATVLTIAPSFLPAPKFIVKPTISNPENGQLTVTYQLDMEFDDESFITWYRCKDAYGKDPIKVAVSRYNKPMYNYTLSKDDVGWYIMASVAPKHLRCNAGEPEMTVYPNKITRNEVPESSGKYIPNLENLPGEYQPKILPGFWTMDSYAPADTHEWYWEADNSHDPWYFGTGINGAAKDTGLVQNTKGARLRYWPVGDTFGDMELEFTAVPSKTAGQGFSSARAQYMDIGIKMDVKTMTGYALRLIRTTKYGDAIDFMFMEYKDGVASPISEPVTASCYRPNCRIKLKVSGNQFSVDAVNLFDSYFTKHDTSEVKRVVHMETEITPNTFGGISFQHTGSVGSGATLIKDLSIQWKE